MPEKDINVIKKIEITMVFFYACLRNETNVITEFPFLDSHRHLIKVSEGLVIHVMPYFFSPFTPLSTNFMYY